MRTKNSRGLTFVACLAVCVFGLSLIGCGGGGKSDAPSSTPVPKATGVYKIDITSTDSPAFQGHVFPGIGTYDRIQGVAYGVLDPNDPRNQVIADIALAPVNDNGLVEYESMFYILTPTDATKRGKVMFEPPNRGNKQFGTFNQSGGANTVGAAAGDAAAANSNTVPTTPATYPGFLFNKGYTTMWAGWDMEPMSNNVNQIRAELPIATNPDNTSITGPVYDYLVDASAVSCKGVYYGPADDNTAAVGTKLTVRAHLTDPPVLVDPGDWKWNGGPCSGDVGPDSISLISGNFTAHSIYELEYIAKDPYVATAGFAAMRDVVSFFRYAAADSVGNTNPLAGNINQIMVWTNSQPGRLMNDYIWLGFNEDTKGRIIFDGSLNYIGGGDGLGINYRFAQVGRTERNRQNHIAQLEGVFPFSYTQTTDALTGKTDGRNVRCTASNTCPKVMNLYSANEMWVKTASLATTHPNTGDDLVEPANVRNYQISGAQHGNGSMPGNITATSQNLYPATTVNPQPVFRALWEALDKWISDGTPPPASKVSRKDDGTLIPVLTDNPAINDLGIGLVPLASIDFPNLYAANLMPMSSIVVTVRNYWDFSAAGTGDLTNYNKGILEKIPPAPTGDYYFVQVAKVDNTGNEIGGLRLPEVVAPLGTNAGWNVRAAAGSGKADGTDGAEGTGAFIPLALKDADKAGACASDPRPSLEELYGQGGGDESDWHAVWLAQRIARAQELYDQGFLLEKDRDNYETSGQGTFTVGTNVNHTCWYPYTWAPGP